jgi:hypothetical protein
MIRTALLICAGLLMALCFACVPPPSVPPRLIAAAQPLGMAKPYLFLPSVCPQNTTDGNVFAAAVLVLPPGFRPDIYSNYRAPSLGSLHSITRDSTTIAADLVNAFNAAPQGFKNDLCGLNGVFINTNDCPNGSVTNCSVAADRIVGNSWGYREGVDQTGTGSTGGRYIAISAGLWPTGGNAIAYNDFETRLLLQLLSLSSSNSNNPVYLSTANPNDSKTTVLAALAHEFGHVLWYDSIGHQPLSSGGVAICAADGASFFVNSWDTADNPPIWHTFGEPLNQHKKDFQPDNVDILTITRTLGRNGNKPERIGAYLDGIYGYNQNGLTGRWASLRHWRPMRIL